MAFDCARSACELCCCHDIDVLPQDLVQFEGFFIPQINLQSFPLLVALLSHGLESFPGPVKADKFACPVLSDCHAYLRSVKAHKYLCFGLLCSRSLGE